MARPHLLRILVITLLLLAVAVPAAASAATSPPIVPVDLTRQGSSIATVPEGSIASQLRLVQQADGSAAASWHEDVHQQPSLVEFADVVVVRPPGNAAWTAPLRLERPAGLTKRLNGRLDASNIVGLGSGRFALLTGWSSTMDGDGIVHVRIWNGASWSEPVLTFTGASALAGFAADEAGRVYAAVIADTQATTGSRSVVVKSWKDGATTTSSFALQQCCMNAVRLAASSTRAAIVWDDDDASHANASIWMSTSDAEGRMGEPVAIETRSRGSSVPLRAFQLNQLVSDGTSWFLSWASGAVDAGTDGRLYYRYGADLLTAPTQTWGEGLPDVATQGIYGGSWVFRLSPRGPLRTWASHEPCGIFAGILGQPDSEALRISEFPGASEYYPLAGGESRYVMSPTACPGQAVDAAATAPTMLVTGPDGTMLRRYRITERTWVGTGAVMPVPAAAGGIVRLAWLRDGRTVRSGVLHDLGATSDRIVGGAEHDTLAGNGGSDAILGNAGNDVILAGTGGDAVSAGPGHDTVSGGAGNDGLIGGAGNDTMAGGTGADVITGGIGIDRMFGGAGADWIRALDGRVDFIHCGPGLDRVIADLDDRVSRTCERITRARRFKL